MTVCHDSIALDVMHIRSRVARWGFCVECIFNPNYVFSESRGITGIWWYFWHILENLEKLHIFLQKKMFNKDEGKIELAVGNHEGDMHVFGRARRPRLS